MFGSHFYHATIRKSVAVFGTLFNNISVIRKDGSGGILNQVKVPLAYGPKQKFLARLSEDLGQSSMALKLPRMAFEITSIDIDLNQKQNKRNKITNTGTNSLTRDKIDFQVPYNIGMELTIMANNQDDGLQVMEQILPYFQPDYTVSIKPIDGWTDFKQDVPVVLTSVAINDDYEADFQTRRVLTYTLGFTMKMTFYSSKGTQKVIKEIDIDYSDFDNRTVILADQNIQVNPLTAIESDTLVTGTPGANQYKIVTTIDFINQPQVVTLEMAPGSGTFSVGEIIIGTSSGSRAKVGSFTDIVENNVLIRKDMGVIDADGYFQPSETITGETSNASGTLTTWNL
jgi:hypothetical protein